VRLLPKGLRIVSGQEDKVRDAATRCRYCGRRLPVDDPEMRPFLPFCSERCKMADLGGWLEGRYVISRKLDEVFGDAALKAGGKKKLEGRAPSWPDEKGRDGARPPKAKPNSP
jgi:uncharacterized protein